MKPIGSNVGLYYDSPVMVSVGDYLQTPTGRTYVVSRARLQERGIHAGRRQHLRAFVVAREDVPEGATVRPIIWYPRRRRRS